MSYPEPKPDEGEALIKTLCAEATVFTTAVGFPRFNRKLEPAEVGLRETAINKDLISLGRKKLLGKQHKELEPFELLESQVNAFINENSFSLFSKLRAVPNGKLDEVVKKLHEFEATMSEISTMFMVKYESIVAAAIEEWREYAYANKDIVDKVSFVQGIRNAFPSLDKIQSQFKFSWVTFTIQAPKDLHLKLTTVSEQKAIAQAKDDVTKEAVKRLAQEASQDVEQFVSMMRAEAAKTLEAMLKTMDEGKLAIHQKTLNRIHNYIEKFKSMNFVGDNQLNSLLHKFASEFEGLTAKDFRKDGDALAAFKTSLANASEEAKKLAAESTKQIVDSYANYGGRKVVID